jgi:hypothetical protein
LVTADFGAIGVGPSMIGVVDHARGQPEHTPLNLF